jgi:anti-sigma regulatory factor (Ser/Thr protein kinase)
LLRGLQAERRLQHARGEYHHPHPRRHLRDRTAQRLIRHFGELHEIPGRTLYAVNLAVDELVTNAVLYGFDEGSTEEIVVQIEAQAKEVRAVVTDEGREFDPLSAPAPDLTAPLETRTVGGLGIHLVRSLMDDVQYARDGNKNLLTIRKRIR